MADNSETIARVSDVSATDVALGSEQLRAAPAVGTRIGRYIVEATIGSGGMGIVVAARHEQLDEVVAIKLLHAKATKDSVQVERFIREARATVRIKSEHVVRVLDVGADERTGTPFIVMEYLPGRDVGYILSNYGAMPVQMAVDYIIQICEAVAAAHALGIIHRDLKPSNFFVTQRSDGSGLVKVLDFGISKAARQDGAPDPRLTETHAVFGSPTYMSPEQIRSSKNVDPRSDVWSLGVALFEMLTEKLPFIADNVPGLLASVIADPPFRVSVFAPHVPEELEMIVLACLEKDPAMRIGSAAELAARLAPFATAEGAQLAQRIDRIARGVMSSSQSFPPPPGSAPQVGPLPPLNRPSFVPPMPVAFGSTGTDLSATRSSRVPSGGARTVAIIASAIAIVATSVVVVLYLGRASDRNGERVNEARRAEAATAPPISASPPPPVLAPAPIASDAPAPVATTSAAHGSVPPRAKPGGAAGRPRGPAGVASSTAGPASAPPPPAPAPAHGAPVPGSPDLGLDRRL